MTKDVRPTTMVGIKTLATEIKRAQGIKHHAALDFAAKQAGYVNHRHAQRMLGASGSPTRPTASQHTVYVTVYWRDRDTKVRGRETLRVLLSKSWNELVDPPKLSRTRRLDGFFGVAHDHIEHRYHSSSQSQARRTACEAVRALQFMDVTGLRPSVAWSRAFPGLDSSDRLPGLDHASIWYDRKTKRFVIANEPYEAAALSRATERAAWVEEHDFDIVRTEWPGMYNPDGDAQLYLVSHRTKGVPLAPIAESLNLLPPPVVEDTWNGESGPGFPLYSTPNGQPLPLKRRAAPKAPPKRKPANRTMHPARKLLVEGMNHLVLSNLVSLDGGDRDEEGHCMAILAGKPSVIRWNGIGHEELSFSVWWDYDHSKHPQANLEGNAREGFRTAAPLAKRRLYPGFVGAVAAGWFERKTGKHIQGIGKRGVTEIFMRRDTKLALGDMLNPHGEGFRADGDIF